MVRTDPPVTGGRIRNVLRAVVAALALAAVLAATAEAGTVGVTGRIQGAGSIASVEGGPYHCSQTNDYDHNAARGCERKAFEAAFQAFVWLRSTPADFPAGSSEWRFDGWSGCDQTRLAGTECLVISGSFTRDERSPLAKFRDVRAPRVSFQSLPSVRTGSPTAAPRFSSPDAFTAFRCQIDGAATFTPCVSGTTYGFADGRHTFRVIGVDPSGNQSAPLSHTWVVDTLAPAASLEGEPADGLRTNSRTAAFRLGANEPASLKCSLDSPEFTDCMSTFTAADLGDGTHVLRVKADDGLREGPVVTRTWTVDTVAPVVTIRSGPPARVSSRTAVLELDADEPATFLCSLDGAAFTACPSTWARTDLTEGAHTLQVKAGDGLQEGPVVSHRWTVDTQAPRIAFTSGPVNGGTSAGSVAFTFGADEAAGWTCRLDDGPFTACDTGSVAFTALDEGLHRFTARASDGLNPAAEHSLTWVVAVPATGIAVDEGADVAGYVPELPPALTDATAAWTIAGTTTTGGDTPAKPAIRVTLSYRARAARRATTFSTLALGRVPAGATIKATCTGRCPRKKLTIARAKGGRVKLDGYRGKPLGAGARLTIAVTKAGMTGVADTLKMRASKQPARSTRVLR